MVKLNNNSQPINLNLKIKNSEYSGQNALTVRAAVNESAPVEINSNLAEYYYEETKKIMNKTIEYANLAEDNADRAISCLETHINNKTNPHEVTKSQIGLANVDNTSDIDKPVSGAVQSNYVLNTTHETDLSTKANIDLSNLSVSASTTINKITSYPKYICVTGYIANSSGGTMLGYGSATILLYANGMAEIHFDYKVEVAGTGVDVWQVGLNRDLLRNLNGAIPLITPVTGGTLQYAKHNGIFDHDLQGFGGINLNNSDFVWQPARVYTTQGAIGGYPDNALYQNLHMSGVAFGTYVVGTEG